MSTRAYYMTSIMKIMKSYLQPLSSLPIDWCVSSASMLQPPYFIHRYIKVIAGFWFQAVVRYFLRKLAGIKNKFWPFDICKNQGMTITIHYRFFCIRDAFYLCIRFSFWVIGQIVCNKKRKILTINEFLKLNLNFTF